VSIKAVSSQSLSRSEQAEMLEYLPAGAADFRPVGLAPGELGEPGTAIVIVALSMAAITGLCAWVGTRGNDVGLNLKVKVPGFESEVGLTITGRSKPELVRQELVGKGVVVPDA
jgi:hypothetical protein